MGVATADMEEVAIGAARLRYHRGHGSGSRSPLILVHPWFGCWQFWRRTVEALPEIDTYAVDLYSLGEAPDWRDFAGPEQMGRAVVKMADALGLKRFSVIGNSMGGIAGQALAAANPDRVDRLILVGTGARTTGIKPEFRQALDDWIAGGEDRGFTERMVDSLLARRPADAAEFVTFVDMVAGANKAFMGQVLTTAFALDLRPRLPQIRASTLVIRGAHDQARTRAHVEELLAGIPDCRDAEIPGGGHSPQVDSPVAFTPLVRDFLLT